MHRGRQYMQQYFSIGIPTLVLARKPAMWLHLVRTDIMSEILEKGTRCITKFNRISNL